MSFLVTAEACVVVRCVVRSDISGLVVFARWIVVVRSNTIMAESFLRFNGSGASIVVITLSVILRTVVGFTRDISSVNGPPCSLLAVLTTGYRLPRRQLVSLTASNLLITFMTTCRGARITSLIHPPPASQPLHLIHGTLLYLTINPTHLLRHPSSNVLRSFRRGGCNN